MKKVTFLATEQDGQSVLFVLGLVPGKGVQVISGDARAAAALGIPMGPVFDHLKEVFPDEGLAYLEAMKYAFTGTMIRATGVYDE